MAVGIPLFDADIDFPVEVEGSPNISTDEITRAKLIVRTYAQKKDNYVPLAQGARDPRYTAAVLLNEQQAQQQGPVLWFNRNYAEIPATRIEPVQISFPYPGKSAVQTSKLTGLPIGWSAYGQASPYTQPLLAKATYSYAFCPPGVDPRVVFSVPALSNLTYNGSKVDYVGSVYVSVGQVSIPQAFGAAPVIEQRFQFAGIVGGFASGQNWIYSTNIRRYRGPIWELEVVQVDSLILP